MASKLPPQVVITIATTVIQRTNGASLNDIIIAFASPPSRRTAYNWVTSLVADGILLVDVS